MEERELIWVSKEQAEKHKAAESDEQKAKVVLDIIDKKKIDFRKEIELLNEDALLFKAACLTHKAELEKAYLEQGKAIEDLWESLGDIDSKIKHQSESLSSEVKKVTDQIAKAKSDVDSLNKSLSGMSVHGADNLIRLSELIERLDDGSKHILSELLKKKV